MMAVSQKGREWIGVSVRDKKTSKRRLGLFSDHDGLRNKSVEIITFRGSVVEVRVRLHGAQLMNDAHFARLQEKKEIFQNYLEKIVGTFLQFWIKLKISQLAIETLFLC